MDVPKCPCGEKLAMSGGCQCGSYSAMDIALWQDELKLKVLGAGQAQQKYDGPRLCKFDEYAPCMNPTECWGDLVNGHCWWDNDFVPEPSRPREWKLHSHAPMKSDAGPITYIDVDRQRGHETAEPVPEHLKVTTGGNGPHYCAINRGSCPDLGRCTDRGGCVWRYVADNLFKASREDIEWCLEMSDDPDAVGQLQLYKTTKAREEQEAELAMSGNNLEEIMGVQQKLDEVEPRSPREAAYDEALGLANEHIKLAATIYHDDGIVSTGRNPKDVAGSSKPQYHLVPVNDGVARVMMLGAKKYGPFNWREKRITYSAYVSACMRHIKAFRDGQDLDPESGESHIDHAMACLMILSDAFEHGSVIDDRPHNPKVK